MIYPLVEELKAEGVRVTTTCRVLGFSTQGFYKWRATPCSTRDRDDAELANVIVDIHADNPEFGYRFVADELHRKGWCVSENRLQRLCQQHRIISTTVKLRPLTRSLHRYPEGHGTGCRRAWWPAPSSESPNSPTPDRGADQSRR
jgi:putative transposase